jgi:hypothetical protein
MRASWVAALVVLSACGDEDDPTPFPLTGGEFLADFDLANGPQQCTGDGVLQFTGSGAELAGTFTAQRHCSGEDTDLSGAITSGTLDGAHVTFTVVTEPALCTFTLDEGRDGSNEELRGSVECQYGVDTWTGLFLAFRTRAS